MIVGIDEAGRGPLAGSVVACALTLKNPLPFAAVDSKKTSVRRREEIFSWLKDNSIFFVAFAGCREIDELNILEATYLAFNRAISGLIKKFPRAKNADFIIDGNTFKTDMNLRHTCVPGADRKIAEVACASIMAKVTRDHLMGSLDFLYPQWKFKEHKGYPTKEHFRLLKKYPLTPFHRRSFSPCSL